MITPNQVYTNLENAFTSASLEVYCTQSYERVPASLPCVYFREEHYRPKKSATFKLTDEQFHSTVYIELYSNADSSAVRSKIEQTMGGMYFLLESCIQIDSGDPDIERYEYRFSRTICGGDTL